MRKQLATYALAGALGLTGVAGAALVSPAVSYAATGDSSALDGRVASIKDALKGLVTDGTLTQAQADEVAATIAASRPEGGRGSHVHLAAAADALGITEEELRTAAQAGTTLAELAQEEGVSTDTLVDALVTAERTRLAEAVSAGRLTQAQADERLAGAETRIAESLDRPIGLGGHGRGAHGRHGGHHGEPSAVEAPSSEAPADPVAPAPSASASSGAA